MKLDIGKDEFAEVLLPCQEFQGWTLDHYIDQVGVVWQALDFFEEKIFCALWALKIMKETCLKFLGINIFNP